MSYNRDEVIRGIQAHYQHLANKAESIKGHGWGRNTLPGMRPYYWVSECIPTLDEFIAIASAVGIDTEYFQHWAKDDMDLAALSSCIELRQMIETLGCIHLALRNGIAGLAFDTHKDPLKIATPNPNPTQEENAYLDDVMERWLQLDAALFKISNMETLYLSHRDPDKIPGELDVTDNKFEWAGDVATLPHGQYEVLMFMGDEYVGDE